jgi:DNA-binding SARP family transcriptional activator
VELLEHQSADEDKRTLYLLRVARAEPQHDMAFPLARITTCGTLTIEVLRDVHTSEAGQLEAVYGPPDAALLAKKGSSTACTLLALLASQPGNFATKDWLSEKLGHLPKDEEEEDLEDLEGLKRVDNVVSLLRHLLYPARSHESWDEKHLRRSLVAYQRASGESGPGYRLAGAPLLWLDVEEMSEHVKRARRLEQFGKDGLAEWQAAYDLAIHGRFLPNETYSDWAEWRRQETETHLWDCVQTLWRRYAEQGGAGETEALRILRDYWLQHPTKEDTLRPLLELLGKREWYGQAEEYYEHLCTALAAEGKEPDQRTRETMDFLRALQIQRRQTSRDDGRKCTTVHHTQAFLTNQQQDQPSSFSLAVAQDIMERDRIPEGDLMDQLRRQILQQALKGTGVVFLASHDLTLGSEIAERLAKALAKPSHIDEKTLLYLEKRIDHYWQDRNDVALPAWDLLPYVLEDLQRVTKLLEGSLRPTSRTHLCSMAGSAAMLIGELYYDMRNYAQSRNFQEIAITAAHEANNAALETVAWGRNSFAWTYDGNPNEARNSIQQARRLASSVNNTIRTWLAAVEAEIQSNLGDREACLKALKEAAHIEDGKHQRQDCYWIHFDRSLFAGYQGVSFLKLSHLGHKDLVPNAQNALQDALGLLDPSMKRRQPTLLIDLAGTYVQQKNIEQACGCAIQAINIAMQINSKVLLQRLLTLRSDLDPWKETCYVQDLDRCTEPLLLPERQ